MLWNFCLLYSAVILREFLLAALFLEYELLSCLFVYLLIFCWKLGILGNIGAMESDLYKIFVTLFSLIEEYLTIENGIYLNYIIWWFDCKYALWNNHHTVINVSCCYFFHLFIVSLFGNMLITPVNSHFMLICGHRCLCSFF